MLLKYIMICISYIIIFYYKIDSAIIWIREL